MDLLKGARRSPVPLYSQIEQHIRARIQSGELAHPDQIESEAELAIAFSVSRMTARKAIDNLVREGLLFRIQGKGTFVCEQAIAYGLSTQLSFSQSLESRGHRVETIVLEAGLVEATPEVAREMDLDEGVLLVKVRRLRLVDGAPAAVHESWVPVFLRAILDQDLTGSLNYLMTSLGLEVTTAHDRVEASLATKEVATLLECEPGAALLRVRGTGMAFNGQNLRYTEALYRADKFFFSLVTGESGGVQLEIKP